jgi:hypothetical protein
MNVEGIPETACIEIDSNQYFDNFIPDSFREDPFAYFEKEGRKIKEGDIRLEEGGRVKEDPTAVVDFPTWVDDSGRQLELVAKRVNIEKAQISREDDPFYEYRVMEIVRYLNLPCPMPIVKVRRGSEYMIVMEKVKGFRLVGKDLEELKSRLHPEQIQELKSKAEEMMADLKKRFEDAGIIRSFKLTDMILEFDFSDANNPAIKSMTPVDWERTKIDMDELGKAVSSFD